MRLLIDQTENSTILIPVDDLIIENNKAVGVISQMGHRFFAKKIILTTGTFLQGKIHIGEQRVPAGRAGDPAATTLAQSLRQLPLNLVDSNRNTCTNCSKFMISQSPLLNHQTHPNQCFLFWHSR